MTENEPQLDVPESEDNFSPEHVAELLARLVDIAVEVDKPGVQNFKIEDFGDDDVVVLEKFIAWFDGNKQALTKEDIDFYIKARDISEKTLVDGPNPNLVVKRALANIIINKTPEIWM